MALPWFLQPDFERPASKGQQLPLDIVDLQNWAYIHDLPEDIAPARKLLRSYSDVSTDEVDEHIIRVVSHPRPRRPCILA